MACLATLLYISLFYIGSWISHSFVLSSHPPFILYSWGTLHSHPLDILSHLLAGTIEPRLHGSITHGERLRNFLVGLVGVMAEQVDLPVGRCHAVERGLLEGIELLDEHVLVGAAIIESIGRERLCEVAADGGPATQVVGAKMICDGSGHSLNGLGHQQIERHQTKKDILGKVLTIGLAQACLPEDGKDSVQHLTVSLIYQYYPVCHLVH